MIEVKGVILDIDGKQVNLSTEEARKLLAQLEDLLGEKSVPMLPPYPSTPYEPWSPRPPFLDYPIITCSDNSQFL